MKIVVSLTVLAVLCGTPYAEEGATRFEDFDNHHWVSSFGGNAVAISQEKIEGKDALKVSVSAGKPGYAFLNAERFPSEDWSDVDRVELDIYYAKESGHNSKIEIKDGEGETVDVAFSDLLPADQWVRVGFNLNPDKDFSEVGQVILSMEKVEGALDVHFTDLALRKDGKNVAWDSMQANGVDWHYAGDTAPKMEGVAEPRTTRESRSAPASLALRWQDEIGNGVNFHEATRRFEPPEDVSDWKQIRFRVLSEERQVAFKPFMWDGDSGYTVTSKSVSGKDHWEILTFDLDFSTEPDFDPKNVTEFKVVVENIDYGEGGNSGQAYVDDIEILGRPSPKPSGPESRPPQKEGSGKRGSGSR